MRPFSSRYLRRCLVASGLLMFSFLSGAWGLAADPPAGFRIVGYLPEYRFSRFDAGHAATLTDLILFAIEPTREGEIDLGKLKNAPWPMLKEFKTRHRIRLWICMGGWGRSDNFAEAVRSESRREHLIQSCVRLLLEHRLDGLDLDWEHPRNDEEAAGYARLIVGLHSAFQPHGLQLSVTIAPWQRLPAEALQAADWVQLMSYDYGQRHSSFEQAQKDVQTWLDLGIPADRLVLGMPFYGRDIEHREKSITWQEVVRRFHPPDQIDEAGGYFFNGPGTIRRKTRHALDAGLGGVMVWEIGQDTQDESSLLKCIQAEVQTGRAATRQK